MKVLRLAILGGIVLATAAYAHTGVQNPVVKAWMDSMEGMAAELKILGQMVKGEAEFDPALARAAAAEIAKFDDETPALFEAEADDPKSEAKPVIWTSFDDFVEKSDSLELIAGALAESIADKDDLRLAMRTLGAECQACHELYRE